jgi:ATPase subunit of ABC transporter with duplicated ATPase domains
MSASSADRSVARRSPAGRRPGVPERAAPGGRAVLRVVATAAVPGQFLLDAAADLVDRGDPEAGDMKGVQHPHRARQPGAQRRVEQDEHPRLKDVIAQARDRLSTGWRPDKGSGKHQRQSRAPGVVQALNRQRDALDAYKITMPPPLGLRWPDLGARGGASLLRAVHDEMEVRLAGPVSLTLDAGDRLLMTGENGAGKSTLLSVYWAGSSAPPAEP